jgi:G3E family GTPase
VLYVYEKQLEEADLIVINKSDVLNTDLREALKGVLSARFPRAQIVTVSARTGANLDDWFARLSGPLAAWPAMEVDYDVYAEGEARLGWVNATFHLSAPTSFEGNRFLQRLADAVRDRLAAAGIEIAHFKMTLAPDTGTDLAVLNLVGTDGRSESIHRLREELMDGELTMNLRAEGDPEQLNEMTVEGLQQAARESGVSATVEHSEHFRPARPEPTHRMATP